MSELLLNSDRRAWKYVVISPVRDERTYIEFTLNSMKVQTVQPLKWVVVDDGSTDGTREFLRGASESYPRLELVERVNRGFRQPGVGVVEAFNDGFRRVEDEVWDFVVKLDGDLTFGADYFERCFRLFDQDAKLGIAGGTICNMRNGILRAESRIDPKFHVRGATKIYRAACWKDIGGLITAPGWDGMDELKANMLGWSTKTFEGIEVLHHRPAGTAYGRWKDWKKGGLGNYIAGYHPLFMAAKCARRLVKRPYLVASTGLMAGFVSGYFRRIPQIPDKHLIAFVRKEQLRKLFGRKSLWVH